MNLCRVLSVLKVIARTQLGNIRGAGRLSKGYGTQPLVATAFYCAGLSLRKVASKMAQFLALPPLSLMVWWCRCGGEGSAAGDGCAGPLGNELLCKCKCKCQGAQCDTVRFARH